MKLVRRGLSIQVEALLIFILIFILVSSLAILLAINVKSSYTTLIRVDTVEQHDYIVQGKEPNIDFVSLQDTPYNEEVKILRLKYHTTIRHLFDSDHVVDEWLGAVGIRNYPKLVR